jgi:hypothetical protein
MSSISWRALSMRVHKTCWIYLRRRPRRHRDEIGQISQLCRYFGSDTLKSPQVDGSDRTNDDWRMVSLCAVVVAIFVRWRIFEKFLHENLGYLLIDHVTDQEGSRRSASSSDPAQNQ